MFPYVTLETVKMGNIAGGTAAAQLPDVSCRLVKFVAGPGNSGNVYLGGSGVTVAAAGTVNNATSGLILDAGQDSGWIPLPNLNKLYRICDGTADFMTYIALE